MAASMLNASADDRYILSSGGQTKKLITGGMALITKHGSLRIAFRIRDTAKWLIDDILIEADQWHHVSATWSKDGYLTCYVNGIKRKKVGSSSVFSSSSTVSSVMHVGKPNNNNIKHGEVSLDDWYFWNRVLSSGDVETVYSMYFMQ